MEKKKESEQNHWQEIQKNLADGNGMAVVVVDENSKVIDEANNNSICKILYSSDDFSSECDKFCGKAFEMASRAGKTVEYKCYAGLECRAVPVKIDEKIKFAAIVGRAFTKTSNYREAAERAFSGDWKKFPPTRFFDNVLLKGAANDLEKVAKSIENFDDNKKDALEKFVEKESIQKSVNIENSEKSGDLEILRLREELKRRGWLEQTVQKFNDILREIDSDDFWLRLTQIFAELLCSERGSLLLLDEKSGKLFFKAAIGANAEAIEQEKENLGARVAHQVLAVGKPLIIEDVGKVGLKAAPAERNYRTRSFISYPLSIGERSIGVLNLTDKTDGEPYNEFDLQLLDSIMPQLAVLIDRAALKHKAGEFEQLSVTDALTGLLNRRYLEERLAEELKWRSLFGSLFNLSYKQACQSILDFISKRYSLNALAWVERQGNQLTTILANGKLQNHSIQISLSADSGLLKDNLQGVSSLKLKAEKSAENDAQLQGLQFFPIAIGGEIRGGLIVGDEAVSKKIQHQITRFCQNIASQLEILRLREELKRRGWLEQTVQKFNDILREIDSDDFWLRLTQIFAELLCSERGSLLLLDEKSGKLFFKAAIGANAAAIEEEKENLGARVAHQVLAVGKPLIIEDVGKVGLKAAPVERNYRTRSFISYPLSIGERSIGVLNLTDKTDGEPYNEFDLQLLDSIMPQLAVLIDRAALKHKAGEFEQLSVTDALTGLLNRRYLEERLAEEIKRSNREGFPMSFLMIDVDDFKSYNDKFSHPEGDKALKLVARLFKETLRGADVAARYGGEEFSILLPQTTTDEAKTIAERIRENVEKTEFDMRRVTVSIGIASCSKIICNAQEIISAADKALYKAKSLGRNNVQIFEDSIDEQKSNS